MTLKARVFENYEFLKTWSMTLKARVFENYEFLKTWSMTLKITSLFLKKVRVFLKVFLQVISFPCHVIAIIKITSFPRGNTRITSLLLLKLRHSRVIAILKNYVIPVSLLFLNITSFPCHCYS